MPRTKKPEVPILVFVGTYPPRECGIGTFTQDLVHSVQTLTGSSLECQVAAFNISATETHEYPPEVRWEIDQDNLEEHKKLAHDINKNDRIENVVVQHEYGIYGGEWGKNILTFLKACKKTKLICMHTVLPKPEKVVRDITEKLVDYTDIIIVLTNRSRSLLLETYPTAAGKVFVIPHGIHPMIFKLPKSQKQKLGFPDKTILSTFGLLSRGKGIEYVIKSLPEVAKKHPDVMYLVLGETHPILRRKEGENYRMELTSLVKKLKLTKHVKFYDKYFTVADLLKFLQATDVYVSTSLDPDQAVSGTFSYAIGTGRAIVSTEFSQAKEVISDSLGRLVAIKSPSSYADALLAILKDHKKLLRMYHAAYEKTRSMLWPNVAHEYLRVLDISILPEIDLNHLRKMTDPLGMLQFSKLSIPNPEYGYTLDDNARALILTNWLTRKNKSQVYAHLKKYLHFLKTCQSSSGLFINYISSRNYLDSFQNAQENLEDANSRALWALSETISNPALSPQLKRIAFGMWNKAIIHAESPVHLRPKAFIIKALAIMLSRKRANHTEEYLQIIIKHADSLVASYYKHKQARWRWFEKELTYANALLPEALLIAGIVTENKEYLKVAKQTLDFLIKQTFMGDVYVPIGQGGWFKKGKRRSYFDQQPEDPAAMVIALSLAYYVFGEEKYRKRAFKCFSWFHGNNLLGLSVYEPENGGVYDGVTKRGLNKNQGAESLVMYLMSRIIIEEVL